MDTNNYILLFDGVCNLCNNAVKFVIKHDKRAAIKFAALQSAAGQNMLQQFNIPQHNFQSFVYIKHNKAFTKSTAALHLLKDIQGGWQLLFAFIIVPKFIRDFAYAFVAKRRYKWFGKTDSCMIPTAAMMGRFL